MLNSSALFALIACSFIIFFSQILIIFLTPLLVRQKLSWSADHQGLFVKVLSDCHKKPRKTDWCSTLIKITLFCRSCFCSMNLYLVKFYTLLNISQLSFLNAYMDIFILSVSMSAMISNAFFHLIPTAYQITIRLNIDGGQPQNFILLSWSAILGILLVFVFELVVHHFFNRKSICSISYNHKSGFEPNHSERIPTEMGKNFEKNKDIIAVTNINYALKKKKKDNRVVNSSSHHEVPCHGDHSHCHSLLSSLDLQSLALQKDSEEVQHIALNMILSSCLHNIGDGFSVGVAFQDISSLSTGISTTISVLFHELPSQLTSVIFLFRSGLDPFVALALNFSSSLFFYVGTSIFIFESSQAICALLHIMSGTNFLSQALCILLPLLKKALCVSPKQSTAHDTFKKRLSCIAGLVTGTATIASLAYCDRN